MFNHNVALINLCDIDNGKDEIFFVHNNIKYKVIFTRGYNEVKATVHWKFVGDPKPDFYKFMDEFTFDINRCEMIYVDLCTGDIGPVNSLSLEYTFMKEDAMPPICRDVKRKELCSYLKRNDVTILRTNLCIDGIMRISTKQVDNIEKQIFSERDFKKGEQVYISYPDEECTDGIRTEILTVI